MPYVDPSLTPPDTRRLNLVWMFWFLSVVCLAGPLLVRCVVIYDDLGSRPASVVDYIYDDGYYYLAIAANFAEFGRSTLDGLTITNGYQPLWLLLLTGLAKLVGTAPTRLFAATCLLVYALVMGAVLAGAAWNRLFRNQISLCIASGLALITLRQPAIFLDGMETVLLLPLAVPLVALFERASKPRELLMLSVLLAITFLVRLDALALYLATLAILLLPLTPFRLRMEASRIGAKIRVGLLLSAAVLPTVAVYLAVNQWLFDTPVPVSGLAKSIGGPKFSNWGISDLFFWPVTGNLSLFCITLPLEWLVRRYARPEPIFYRSFCIVVLAMAIQFIYYSTLSTWYVWPWYEYAAALSMALMIARILYLCSLIKDLRQGRIASYAAIGVLAAWTLYFSGQLMLRSLPNALVAVHEATGLGWRVGKEATFNQISLEMSQSFFPSGRHSVIAMGDRAGGLAFWGRQKLSVVQTEGLTLDMSYIRARIANDGEHYLESRYPIEYFVVDREQFPSFPGADGKPQYIIPEPIQGRVTTAEVPVFCFPDTALRYERSYKSIYGTNRRLAFAFAERISCSAEALAAVRAAETGHGLRQLSLPAEYNKEEGGTFNAMHEDRDRGMRANQQESH